jgi:hypothetical protein
LISRRWERLASTSNVIPAKAGRGTQYAAALPL